MTKKLTNNHNEPSVAMSDEYGNIITSKEDILENTVKHYTKVLPNREIKNGLEDIGMSVRNLQL